MKHATFLIAGVVGSTAMLVHGGEHAHANGRYPQANQLVVDPSNSSHLVARATFGILASSDSGGSWSWICEDAIGYFGSEDPTVAVTAGGSTLVASSRGLKISRDGGCSWAAAAGSVDGDFAVDVTVDPANPHAAVVLEGSIASGAYRTWLRKTFDDGTTWSPYGNSLADDLFVETVEIAASDPNRVYVSGRVSPTQENAVDRSLDGGATWQRTMVPLPSVATAFIGAVDPRNADVVYLRSRSGANTVGQVMMTRDAGVTWTAIWAGPADVAGFALSDDGSTLAVGGPESGVHVASTADFAFRRVSSVGVSCLTWSGEALFACADEAVAGYSLGKSGDRGATFSPVLRFADVAPRTCAAETSASTCGASWPSIAATIGADASSEEAAKVNDTGAPSDAPTDVDPAPENAHTRDASLTDVQTPAVASSSDASADVVNGRARQPLVGSGGCTLIRVRAPSGVHGWAVTATLAFAVALICRRKPRWLARRP